MACRACGEKYADDPDARRPVIFPCLCRLCKGCALQEEVKAQQQEQPVLREGQRKGKGKAYSPKPSIKNATLKPTPCMTCGKLCAVPVAELLVDIALLKGTGCASGGHAHAAAPAQTIPTCEVCEDDSAATFCDDCTKNRLLCDGCHTSAHKSVKKQGHKPVPIKEYLASVFSQAAWAGGGGGGGGGPRMLEPVKKCRIHSGKTLELFCDTCSMLICSLCITQHDRHSIQPISEVTGEHRAEVEAAIAATTASKGAVHNAIKALYKLIKTIEDNEIESIKTVDRIFKPLEQAVSRRKSAMKDTVKLGTRRKKDAIESRIAALEDNETYASAAVSLSTETLKIRCVMFFFFLFLPKNSPLFNCCNL